MRFAALASPAVTTAFAEGVDRARRPRRSARRRRPGALQAGSCTWRRTALFDQDRGRRSSPTRYRRAGSPMSRDGAEAGPRQQPAARRDRGGARRFEPVLPDPALRLAAAEARVPSPDPEALPALEKALGRRKRPGGPRARCSRPRGVAAVRAGGPARTARGDRAAARARRSTGTGPARRASRRIRGRKRGERGRCGPRRDRSTGCGCRPRRQSVPRAQPRHRAAARRDRARDHLWRHGRHQHGAWRDDHARRLCGLCRAAVCSAHFCPACIDAYLVVAVPVAFLFAGLSASCSNAASSASSTGGRSKRCSRPGAVSLILQQAVRSIFGAEQGGRTRPG